MELRPLRGPARARVGDALDELLDERGLGVEQREPVVLLDEEQRVDATLDRAVDQLADAGPLAGEPL